MEKAEGDKSKEPARSRLHSLRIKGGDDYQPAMPPLDCGEHLVDLLWRWGPTMCTSMGDAPLRHQDLAYCQRNTGVKLSGWEAETLVRLSREYFGESHRATKRDCQPPFGQVADEYAQVLRAENRQRIRGFLD